MRQYSENHLGMFEIIQMKKGNLVQFTACVRQVYVGVKQLLRLASGENTFFSSYFPEPAGVCVCVCIKSDALLK